MAELLKMPELTQEQLEAALIIKGILDRFDAETKVDRTTAWTCQEKCSLKTHKDASGWKNDHVFCSGA